MGWIMFGEASHNDTARMSRYAPDLAKDPFYRWLTTYHWVPLTVLGFTLLAIGGWGLVNWAIFLRVVVGLHSTWLVNSATHMWGRRRFATKDDSRNVWWVALLTFGEGWHNNHHAHPTSARHGLAWYEFDVTWLELKALQALGLVWDVRVARISQMSEEEIAPSAEPLRAVFLVYPWRHEVWRAPEVDRLLHRPRRRPGRRRARAQRRLDHRQLAAGRPARRRPARLSPHHHRRRPQHHLPGARDPAQRAARGVHQRRDARAEDAGGVDEALPADPAESRRWTRRSARSSTARCSRTATGCSAPSSRCSAPVSSAPRAGRASHTADRSRRARRGVRVAGADPLSARRRRR